MVICPLYAFFFFPKADSQMDMFQTLQSSYEEEGEMSNFQVFMSDFFTPNNEFYIRPWAWLALEKHSVI